MAMVALGLIDQVNCSISRGSTGHSSDLEPGCNFLCFRAERERKNGGVKGKKTVPAVCIYLVMTIRCEMTRIIWRVVRRVEKASCKTSFVLVRSDINMPELAVNCLQHLVHTSFPTCFFSHLNYLKEILFHHEGSQALENFPQKGGPRTLGQEASEVPSNLKCPVILLLVRTPVIVQMSYTFYSLLKKPKSYLIVLLGSQDKQGRICRGRLR